MSKILEFKALDTRSFISWLKKFSVINSELNKSVLIEIDTQTAHFVAKCNNEERSVVKFSKLSFEEATMEIVSKTYPKERIKIGIYNIPKLVKSLEQFSTGEFSMCFKYDEIIGENEGFTGTDILIKNSGLKMNLSCASLNIFKYISDEQFLNKIAKVDSLVSFTLTKTISGQINSLSSLDSDYKFIDFIAKNNGLVVKGKTFELALSGQLFNETCISIYKEQFEKIDPENYDVEIAEDRLVYRSKDSNTISVTSMVERDDKYDEPIQEF